MLQRVFHKLFWMLSEVNWICVASFCGGAFRLSLVHWKTSFFCRFVETPVFRFEHGGWTWYFSNTDVQIENRREKNVRSLASNPFKGNKFSQLLSPPTCWIFISPLWAIMFSTPFVAQSIHGKAQTAIWSVHPDRIKRLEKLLEIRAHRCPSVQTRLSKNFPSNTIHVETNLDLRLDKMFETDYFYQMKDRNNLAKFLICSETINRPKRSCKRSRTIYCCYKLWAVSASKPMRESTVKLSKS